MRILLLHSDDSPEGGPWAGQRWDRVIDLGMAGPEAYEKWSNFFQCPVVSADFAKLPSDPVRDALAEGRGYIRDQYGIDWWEVLSVRFIQQLYSVLALRTIARDLRTGDDIFVSRDGFYSNALKILLGRPVHCWPGSAGLFDPIGRAYGKVRRLSYAQIRQIIDDKYDPHHRMRARFASFERGPKKPIVLLPSAYVNVSRTAVAYASSLPEADFLLVVARRNGWCERLPENVIQRDLTAYVRRSAGIDNDATVPGWNDLDQQFLQNDLLRVLFQLGAFASLRDDFRRWAAIRDAWLNVFDEEAITSVLCCDDSNPYTLIPLLIARHRDLPTFAAHHGALDGQRRLKPCRAEIMIAKGAMEQDYMIRQCGISRDGIIIAAPQQNSNFTIASERRKIVFFSSDYEVSGGRTEEFYRSILPPLREVARKHEKQVVIKLHPAESLRDRRRIVQRICSAMGLPNPRIIEGLLTEELLADTWFAVTGISTAAVECAVRKIPVFLCEWLEDWPYGYLNQFEKYGVGVRLETPGKIAEIPRRMEEFVPCDSFSLWQSLDIERLQEAMNGTLV